MNGIPVKYVSILCMIMEFILVQHKGTDRCMLYYNCDLCTTVKSPHLLHEELEVKGDIFVEHNYKVISLLALR